MLQIKNSHMPFLRNEFWKIFEDLLTMTEFTKKVDVGDIFELFSAKLPFRKILKVNETPGRQLEG